MMIMITKGLFTSQTLHYATLRNYSCQQLLETKFSQKPHFIKMRLTTQTYTSDIEWTKRINIKAFMVCCDL